MTGSQPSPDARSAALDRAVDEVREVQARHWPDQVPRTFDYPAGVPAMVEHLWHWADTRPDRSAIEFYGRSISYAEYDELSDRFAGWLIGNGIGPGDSVGVYLGNCPQFLVAMLGILKIGAVHVPINPLFQGHELRHELLDADVRAVLVDADKLDRLESVRADTNVRLVAATAMSDMLPANPITTVPFPIEADPRSRWREILTAERAPRRDSDPDALAALNYTGGTTGLPKGCEHTQRHMAYTAATSTVAGGTEVGDARPVSLNFLPVFWIAGEDFAIIKPLINGHSVVLMARWDAGVAAELVEHYRVTDVVATVDSYVELMDSPAVDGARLRSLETTYAVSFVLKLNPEIRSRWRDFAGSVLREASFGMTESHTADTFTLGFQDGDRDLLAEPVFCGLPVPGTDVLVVGTDGTPLPIGEVGEIIMRSPSVMERYHNRPEATAETIKDGWLFTGDQGKLDDWGALHYLARTKEMIKVNGMSVFPSEVEALLKMHEMISGVSVVPRADDRRGQVPVAFTVLSGAVTADELTAWAKANMATYKVPEFVIVDRLPMTATGKVLKSDLFERAAAIAAERNRE